MVPKTNEAMGRDYEDCSKRNVFVRIPKERYADYADEALADLSSAQKELQENVKWAIVKAYQALFLQCNAVLVKSLGFYSKDHGCLITALIKHKLIPDDALEKIRSMLKQKQTLFEEIDSIRLSRNKALYFPKTMSKLGVQESEATVEEVRKFIAALREQ